LKKKKKNRTSLRAQTVQKTETELSQLFFVQFLRT
jgi:hypothetical protein